MINKNIRSFTVKSNLKSMSDFEVDRLIRNAIRTPDGTVLESIHVHDYRTYTDKNGLTYMVDGGLEYLRRNLHEDAPYEELSVYVDEDHEINREYFQWTSYGEDGKGPSKTQALKDMDTDHIQAILDNGFGRDYSRELFQEELAYRCENELTREEKRRIVLDGKL